MTTDTSPPFDPTTALEELTHSFDWVFTGAEISDAVASAQQALEPQAS